VVVRSAVTGPDSSRILLCRHTEVVLPQINIMPLPVQPCCSLESNRWNCSVSDL